MNIVRCQGRSQEFARGTNQGVWGTEVPQRGSGAGRKTNQQYETVKTSIICNTGNNKICKKVQIA